MSFDDREDNMSNILNEDNRSIIIKTCSFLAQKTKDRLKKA